MLEIVRTLELDPVTMREGKNPLRFRIEVLRETHGNRQYYARLCRWETFSVHPWPTDTETEGSVEELLIEDAFWDWKGNPAPTEKVALDSLLVRLSAQLPGIAQDLASTEEE